MARTEVRSPGGRNQGRRGNKSPGPGQSQKGGAKDSPARRNQKTKNTKREEVVKNNRRGKDSGGRGKGRGDSGGGRGDNGGGGRGDSGGGRGKVRGGGGG